MKTKLLCESARLMHVLIANHCRSDASGKDFLLDYMTQLTALGVDMTLADLDGNTPLHLATCQGDLKAVQCLLFLSNGLVASRPQIPHDIWWSIFFDYGAVSESTYGLFQDINGKGPIYLTEQSIRCSREHRENYIIFDKKEMSSERYQARTFELYYKQDYDIIKLLLSDELRILLKGYK